MPFMCLPLLWLLLFSAPYQCYLTLDHITTFTGAVVSASFEFFTSILTIILGLPSLSLSSWFLHLLITSFLSFSFLLSTSSLYYWHSLNAVYCDGLHLSVFAVIPVSSSDSLIMLCFMYLYCYFYHTIFISWLLDYKLL